MLSQTAWKIGRAFTKGKGSAPAEFAEVEGEANGLSDALKITAETLHDDGSILSRTEPETRAAVNAILDSAARTLGDLESFVARYQVIRKRETSTGFVVERSWSDLILANYKTFKWTTEGGNLTDLRNMLQMHTNTINLTMQALQSRSLARLERAVIPIAENINSIHERVNGDLADKIDDLHRIIMSVANSTPSLNAQDRAIEGTEHLRPLGRGSVLALEYEHDEGSQHLLDAPPPHASSFAPVRQVQLPSRSRQDSGQSSSIDPHNQQRGHERRASSIDWNHENGGRSRGSSIGDNLHPSSGSYSRQSPLTASSSGSMYRGQLRRESGTLPALMQRAAEGDDDAQPGSSRSPRSRQQSSDGTNSPISEARTQSWQSTYLPPPALSTSSAASAQPATPSSVLTQDQRSRAVSNATNKSNRPPTAKSPRAEQPPSSAVSSLPAFEKALFRNAAILCDVRLQAMEYAKFLPDEPDPRYNTEMKEICKDARVCVIRKRENREHGGSRLATSVWTLSSDGTVRAQQKLSEVADTVPYCSYFQPEKVSLADNEITIRCHGPSWTDPPEQDVKTTWINYIFASEVDAEAFQSAVYGRLLLGSFRTTKTTVLHQGLMGAFAFEEQFAHIETLRLWEDDGEATPGAQGGVMALLHISSTFGEGWARWWMNSSKQHVRVKGEGTKCARVKGIDVTVVRPGGKGEKERGRTGSGGSGGGGLLERKDSLVGPQVPMRREVVKRVGGVVVEFRDEVERGRFLEVVGRVQGRMMNLPDL